MNFTIVMTDKCNLRCKYCYEKHKKYSSMDNGTQRNTLDFILKKMNEFKEDNRVHRVILHGGEPLLHFEAIKFFVKNIVDAVGKDKVIFELTTNGTIYDKSKFDFLEEYLDSISISVDGGKESHNRHRKYSDGTGSYDSVIENMKKIREHNIVLRGRLTLSSENVNNIFQDIKSVIDMGFDFISVAPNIYDNNWPSNVLDILEREFKLVKEYVESNDIDVRVSTIDDFGLFERKLSCFGGVTSFSISPRGNIYPCIYALGKEELSIGNVSDNKIDDNKVEFFLSLNRKNEECIGCQRIDFCNGNRCKILNKVVTGDYFTPDGFNCVHQSLILSLNGYGS